VLLRSDVLVGRESAYAALAGQLREPGAPTDRVRVMIVEADGGMGKTRLVTDVTGALPAGRTVVWGAGYPGGSDVALLPWGEALRDVVRQWGAPRLAEAAGTAAADFALLVPELGTAGPSGPGRLIELMPWLWGRLVAQEPVVLVLEDLHVADPGTLAVLLRLTRFGRGPLDLVVTARPGSDSRDPEAARRWHEAATELQRRDASVVALAALDAEHSLELADRLVAGYHRDLDPPGHDRPGRRQPTQDELAELAEASGGVPFVLEQLVVARLSGQPAQSLPGDPVLAALESVSAPARELLTALAVHSTATDHDLLEAILGWSSSETIDALSETTARGLVQSGADGGYRTTHALIAERVRADLLPSQRRAWHARVAAALAQRPDDPRATAVLPGHYEAAGQAREALLASVRAADSVAYAPSVAARHYARAAALWALVEDAESLTGSTYDEVVELAATRNAQAGQVDAAVELARGWLAGEGPSQDPARASRLSLLVAARGEWTLPAMQVREAFEQAVAYAERAGGTNLSAALTGQARHLAALDQNHQAEPLARRALAAADGQLDLAYAGATLGSILAHLGDHDAGAASLREAVSAMDPLDNPQERARTLFELVWTEFYAGRAAVARDLALDTVAALGEAGLVQDIRASLHGAAAQIEVWLGRLSSARELLVLGEREDPAGTGRASRLLAAGFLHLYAGTAGDAVTDLLGYVAHWESLGLRENDHIGVPTAAAALLAAGDSAGAYSLVDEALHAVRDVDTLYELTNVARETSMVLVQAQATGCRVPSSLIEDCKRLLAVVESFPRLIRGCVPYADLLTTRAALTSLHGSPDTGRWSEAAAAWAELGFPWWHLRCRLWYAQSLLRTRGARDVAAGIVAEVEAAAAELGANGLVAAAQELTTTAGLTLPATPPDLATASTPEQPDPLDSLTPREREVFALLAEGLSNRAIAERLYISEKTASVHVSNILAKLEVSSRLQAVALVRART
jgi:DNA-binding CsgD family transcriptional regulator/tetratricopeptide (TPR) repeat protein